MSEQVPPGQIPPQEKKSSTGKIVAFVGCGCLGLIAIGAIFIGVIVFGAAKMMKASDAYKDTIAVVQSNPAAIEALGEPIEPGFFVSGSVNINNGEGTADLTIPVSGPKGSGDIRVKAEKPSGSPTWIYSTRELQVAGQADAIPLGP